MVHVNEFSFSARLYKYGINNKGSFPSGWAMVTTDPVHDGIINWPSSKMFISMTGVPPEKDQAKVVKHMEGLLNQRIMVTGMNIIPGQRFNKETKELENVVEVRSSWKRFHKLSSDVPFNSGIISGKILAVSNQNGYNKIMLEQRYMVPKNQEWKTRQIPCLLEGPDNPTIITGRDYTFIQSRIILFDKGEKPTLAVQLNPNFILYNAGTSY